MRFYRPQYDIQNTIDVMNLISPRDITGVKYSCLYK